MNIWEKSKNIFLWKNKTQSQFLFFVFILTVLALYIIRLDNMLIIYILYRFWKGRNYFKRIANWNTQVLYQMIHFFIKNELKFIGHDVHVYFEKNKNDKLEKTNFSKKFSAFVNKYLQIEVSDDHWL